MKESLSPPEGITLVERDQRSPGEIARDLITAGDPVVVAGIDHDNSLRKVWIIKSTNIDLVSGRVIDYRGWQYSDDGTFGFVDTEVGEYGENVGLPTKVFFVAAADESLLSRDAEEYSVRDVIDYVLMHVTSGAPGTGPTSIGI